MQDFWIFFQSNRKASKGYDKESLRYSSGTLARKQKSIVGEENEREPVEVIQKLDGQGWE